MKNIRCRCALLLATWLISLGAMAQTKVTIYSAAPQDLLDHVIPAFETRTKLKVDVIKAGSGELINRLKAEKGRQIADVLFAVSTEVIDANKALFSPFVPDNAKHLGDAFKIRGAAVPFTAVASAIGVNTKLLAPAQYPRTWADLANPIYKGKISAARPDKSGSAFIQLGILLTIYGEDKGWDLYSKILNNLVLSNSSGAVSKFVNDGEASLGLSNEDTLLKYKQGGGPVAIIYPADGTSVTPDSMALSASAANAAGGRAFINFMLSSEAQGILDSVGRRSVRGDVVPKGGLAALASMKLIKFDDDWAGANRARLLVKWNDLLLNKK